jgi:hypothetical protein
MLLRNMLLLESDVIAFNPLNAELNPIRHLLALAGDTILSTLTG